MFWQNRRSEKWGIHFLVKLHYVLCLVGCPKKIKVLIDNFFFRFFKENLDADIFSVWVISIFYFSLKQSLIFNQFNSFNASIISYKQIYHIMRVSFERY